LPHLYFAATSSDSPTTIREDFHGRNLRFAATAALLLASAGSSAAPFVRPTINPVTKAPMPVAASSIGNAQSDAAVRASTENVKDVDAPIRHPYQQTADANNCTFQGDCVVNFPAITNPRVLIQHVSCLFALANSGTPFIVYSSVSSSVGGDLNYLIATKSGGDNGSGYIDWSINNDAYLFLSKGSAPRIDV
jgi:hypothetical protein